MSPLAGRGGPLPHADAGAPHGAGPVRNLSGQAGDADFRCCPRLRARCRCPLRRRRPDENLEQAGHRRQSSRRQWQHRGAACQRRRTRRLHAVHAGAVDLCIAADRRAQPSATAATRFLADRLYHRKSHVRRRIAVASGQYAARPDRAGEKTTGHDQYCRNRGRPSDAPHRPAFAGARRHRASADRPQRSATSAPAGCR